MALYSVLLSSLFAAATAQKIGTTVPEVHPKFPTQSCTTAGGCVTKNTFLVADALSRSLHSVNDPSVSCAGAALNSTLCPDAATCAQNCALEGADYGSLGVLTSGSALTMRLYLFNGTGFSQVSPRLYLLAEDESNYEMLQLVNQEFTYDVDVSQLGCGMNGALYLSEMDASGGRSDLNPAGAKYGTGYCDAQCPKSTFFNGQANLNSSGVCCNEMDIWEANSQSTATTPHTCGESGPFLCAGDQCNNGGICDKSGCGFNPYGGGDKSFYGPGLTVDTKRPFTVVTQFISSDNTTNGTLASIQRLYIQDGRLIQNAQIMVPTTEVNGSTISSNLTSAAATTGTITEDLCAARNASSDFVRLGGLEGMGKSLNRGMVLIFSIWNSAGDFMNWLDSGDAGPCNSTAGDPSLIVAQNPEVSVTFSNVKWGEIGSTFSLSGLSTMNMSSSASFNSLNAETQSSASQLQAWHGILSIVLVGAVSYLVVL